METDKTHFGVIKKYKKGKKYGNIQSQGFGVLKFSLKCLKRPSDEANISKNTLAIFSIKQGKKSKLKVKKISFDYHDFVLENFSNFDEKSLQLILDYGNQRTKVKLQELLSKSNDVGESLNPIQQDGNFGLGFLEVLLKDNDKAFNSALIKKIAQGLGPINSEGLFQKIKQLFQYNNRIEGGYFSNFPQFVYKQATAFFKLRLWLEGITEFCNFEIINEYYSSGDEGLREKILERSNLGQVCLDGFSSGKEKKEAGFEDVYFEGIQSLILAEISKARESIFAAIAWFTNHHFLDALCEKVKEGVTVELIVLNDYINNREGGLDFQKFVDLGKEDGKGKFFFCGPEHIMHHKFCIIDQQVLFNGSYNWTYYAEHRNSENLYAFQA